MVYRKKKIFNRPKKPYDKPRMDEEAILVKKYGLKNKREIWKADFAIGKIRDIAKKLIAASDEEEEKKFIERQQKKGFEVETIAEILSLDKEDYLKRRLQSVVVSKKLATTPRQARQFIAHKHIKVNGKVLDSPSHLTTIEEEASLELDLSLPAKKQELSKEEADLLEETKKAAATPETEEEAKEEKEEEPSTEEETVEELQTEEETKTEEKNEEEAK